MLLSSAAIPISIEPSWADDANGITEVEGLLKYDAGELVLEYRSLDEDDQWSAVQVLKLALPDLSDVELRRSIFGWRVVVRANRMALLEGVPGVERNEVELYVARRDRQRAADLMTRILLDLSERRLADE